MVLPAKLASKRFITFRKQLFLYILPIGKNCKDPSNDYSGSIKYLVSEIFFFPFSLYGLVKTLSCEMISNKNSDPELLIITRGILFQVHTKYIHKGIS